MQFNSIKEAWLYGVKSILTNGDVLIDERNDITLEIPNLVMTISNPFNYWRMPTGEIKPRINNPVTDGLWSNERAIEPYIKEFTTGDAKGFVYTYGNRFISHFKIDQIEEAISRLENNPTSRRATCVTYDPTTDFDNTDIPCLIMLDFKVRDNQLNVTGVWRSHDICQAYYPNLIGVSYLSYKVASHIGVTLGKITTHSISAHIRDDDTDYAKELIKQ